MTTAVQHRRGTTAEHSTFTGLEGEVTIDTTKDTAVIHDGSLAGGYPLAKETLANVNPSTLSAITGAATASDDLFLMYDTSALAMKKISRAELNNAITIEALDTVDINGGTIDGTAIGGTTPAAGAFTSLSATSLTNTGNTTLGNASTDTVTVNGYMGVGGAPSTNYGLRVRGDVTGSTVAYGLASTGTIKSDVTNIAIGISTGLGTDAASFTVGQVRQINVGEGSKGSGSSVTSNTGIYVSDLTNGTNNYGITSAVSSGTNKWNIYASGTADNYFGGSVGVGTTSVAARLHANAGVVGVSYPLILQNTSGSFNGRGAGIQFWGSGTNVESTIFNYMDGTTVSLFTQSNAYRFRNLGATADYLRLNATEAVFNDTGNDIDFRVESDTNTHALFVQGSDGNVGIGTSSPSYPLDVNGLIATRDAYVITSNSSGVPSAGAFIYRPASNTIAFGTNVTERARITSDGKVAIGATSASNTLDVAASGGSTFRVYDSADVGRGLVISAGSAADGVSTIKTNTSTRALAFGTNNTERARIDSSGNLLVGTTTSEGKLTIKGDVNGTQAVFSGTASRGLKISTASGGLANDSVVTLDSQETNYGTLAFATRGTERARIDSSGNVGIGTSSPTRRLTVEASSGAATGIVASNPSVSANAVAILEAKSDSASAFLGAGGSATTASTWGGRASTAVLNTSSSTPGGIAIMARTSGAYITMHTGGDTERARIDSSGNLLVGKTATGLSTVGVEAQADGDLWATADSKQALTLRRNTTDGNIANFWKDGTTVGSISVTSSATAYNTSSDYRLKDNIQDITGSGAFIDALQPRTWNWKADGSAGAGFIAHELQVVSPSSVVGEKDAVDADGNPEYQAVEYGSAEVIAMLVAEVKSLRARLTAAGL